jgi:hypothetical protein
MRSSLTLACLLAITLSPTLSAAEPAKPIDVYLIAGQSNATGQGYMANLPDGFRPNPKVLLFHSGKPHLDSGTEPNTWLPLHQASESPDRFGPELGFGNRLAELRPGRPIALIKHAHSGTNLYQDWEPGKNAADVDHFGPQFKTFIETVQRGLKALRAQGYEPTLRGMVWQQGESDAKNEGTASDYGKNLARFIARVREQFQAPDMLFIYGYVLPPPNAGHNRDLVRQGEKEVDQDSGAALAVKGAFVVATDDLSQRADDRNTRYPGDHVHFGTAGTLELGRRMADKMVDHQSQPNEHEIQPKVGHD